MVKNGNFICLLTFSGQGWQLHMSTDIEWSRMAILYCYWHVVVKNGNFILTTDISVVKNGNFVMEMSTENIHCLSKPRHVTPEIDRLGKMVPVTEGFNTHLCGFWGDRWENINFDSEPSHVTPQIDHLVKWALLQGFQDTFMGFLRT